MSNEEILEAVIFIGIVSIAIFVLILLVRLTFRILLFIFGLFYKPTSKKSAQKKKNKERPNIVVYKKDEEARHMDLNKEKKSEMEQFLISGVERMNQPEINEPERELDNARIVGLAKPIGFWTSLVLGDQLSAILGRAHALNNQGQKGFWVAMLEAQALGLGRQKGKTRSDY